MSTPIVNQSIISSSPQSSTQNNPQKRSYDEMQQPNASLTQQPPIQPQTRLTQQPPTQPQTRPTQQPPIQPPLQKSSLQLPPTRPIQRLTPLQQQHQQQIQQQLQQELQQTPHRTLHLTEVPDIYSNSFSSNIFQIKDNLCTIRFAKIIVTSSSLIRNTPTPKLLNEIKLWRENYISSIYILINNAIENILFFNPFINNFCFEFDDRSDFFMKCLYAKFSPDFFSVQLTKRSIDNKSINCLSFTIPDELD